MRVRESESVKGKYEREDVGVRLEVARVIVNENIVDICCCEGESGGVNVFCIVSGNLVR